jgi:hypothetical protein
MATITENLTVPATNQQPRLVVLDHNDSQTTCEKVAEVIRREGGVVIKDLLSRDLAKQIGAELKPYFDSDRLDPTGFFPETTKRASGLVAISPACIEYLTTPLLIGVVNAILSDEYTFWLGEEEKRVISKPQISSTAAFRVNPGGRAQALHRDDVLVASFPYLLRTLY